MPTPIPEKHTGAAGLESQPGEYVHFLHIGKTGGTAIVHALNQCNCCVLSPRRIRLGQPDPYGLNPLGENVGIPVCVHPHDEGLREVPAGERVVFFLRDPIKRFISGFYSRQRQGQPRYVSPWSAGEQIAYQHFSTVNQIATALSSGDPQEKSRAESAMRTIQHVGDSYWRWFESEEYLRSRLADVWFVGFQESLEHDFDMLARKLDLPADVKLPTDDVLAFRSPSHHDKTLDAAAARNLLQWYKNDYRFIELCRRILGPDILGSP